MQNSTQHNRSIIASAPGKLLLLGDHAVVYSRPCLVTAVDQRLRAKVTTIDSPELHIEAPDVKIKGYHKSISELGAGEIPQGAKFVEIAVKNFRDKYGLKNGIRVETSSDFSAAFGFGSSSASTVCVLKALSVITKVNLDNESLFKLAYKTILDIQGVGSGFDIAAAIYGGTIYFVGGGKKIEPIKAESLELVVGYTGVKASTAPLVKMVAAKAKESPSIYESLFDISSNCVEEGKRAIERNNLEKFGEMMNVNEGLLAAYGVENLKLSQLIFAAREAGAYGAKLSGAGGGDCMIAVASKANRTAVEQAISLAGGIVLPVITNARGVVIE